MLDAITDTLRPHTFSYWTRSLMRRDLHAIIDAAIHAVQPEHLVTRRVRVGEASLLLDNAPLPDPISLAGSGRVVIVGGGKAAAGMAAGLVDVLARGGVASDRISGIVSVPAGCGQPVSGVEVRETRPATENFPTPAAVSATREMLVLLESLAADDVVVALISGGGSALLAAPRQGVPLDEKIAVARFLSAAGAAITEINCVRRAASDVKGGGLARACEAGRMLVLVLSDVIGDPLESIASGPCMPAGGDPTQALAVLERYGAVAANVAPRLVALLRHEVPRLTSASDDGVCPRDSSWTTLRGCRVDHVLLGSNATAVDAAAEAASRLGYAATIRRADPGIAETADEVGRRLAREGSALAAATEADGQSRAIIEGGEAVVRLPANHGLGGRNQQTVAAALADMLDRGMPWPPGLTLASVGTDGEDGPTRAAGAVIDSGLATRTATLGLDVSTAVAHCNTAPLLEAAGGLIVTGPTGTNVADIRILQAVPPQARGPGMH
jgi:hydroxypyruvate reductase